MGQTFSHSKINHQGKGRWHCSLRHRPVDTKIVSLKILALVLVRSCNVDAKINRYEDKWHSFLFGTALSILKWTLWIHMALFSARHCPFDSKLVNPELMVLVLAWHCPVNTKEFPTELKNGSGSCSALPCRNKKS